MKAFQKFVHLNLIVAILLASFGFSVNIEECHGDKKVEISLSHESDCCCPNTSKKTNQEKSSCSEIVCVAQASSIQSELKETQVAQEKTKASKGAVVALVYSNTIRPALLDIQPHFTLPPPLSGRCIGILNQTFLI